MPQDAGVVVMGDMLMGDYLSRLTGQISTPGLFLGGIGHSQIKHSYDLPLDHPLLVSSLGLSLGSYLHWMATQLHLRLVQTLPEGLIGHPYSKARRCFDGVVVCGFIRAGQVQMLPEEAEVMREGRWTT